VGKDINHRANLQMSLARPPHVFARPWDAAVADSATFARFSCPLVSCPCVWQADGGLAGPPVAPARPASSSNLTGTGATSTTNPLHIPPPPASAPPAEAKFAAGAPALGGGGVGKAAVRRSILSAMKVCDCGGVPSVLILLLLAAHQVVL
jgi:hypothetical protein